MLIVVCLADFSFLDFEKNYETCQSVKLNKVAQKIFQCFLAYTIHLIQTMSNESKTQTTNFKENNCLENKSEDEHEENVLWKSKTAEEWYKFPKVEEYL